MSGFRGVLEPDFERDEPLLAEVDGLFDAAGLPVPHLQLLPVLAVLHVLKIETRIIR